MLSFDKERRSGVVDLVEGWERSLVLLPLWSQGGEDTLRM